MSRSWPTDRTLRLWAPVMRAIPGAHLKLMAPAGRHRQRLIERLHAAGIDASRVSFVEFRPREEYLRFYHDVDFGLDTIPYNGHTTTLDALWMGVPARLHAMLAPHGRRTLRAQHRACLSLRVARLDLSAITDGASPRK